MFLCTGGFLGGPEIGLQSRPVLTRTLGFPLYPWSVIWRGLTVPLSPCAPPGPLSTLSTDCYRSQQWAPFPLLSFLLEASGALGGGRREGGQVLNALFPCLRDLRAQPR